MSAAYNKLVGKGPERAGLPSNPSRRGQPETGVYRDGMRDNPQAGNPEPSQGYGNQGYGNTGAQAQRPQQPNQRMAQGAYPPAQQSTRGTAAGYGGQQRQSGPGVSSQQSGGGKQSAQSPQVQLKVTENKNSTHKAFNTAAVSVDHFGRPVDAQGAPIPIYLLVRVYYDGAPTTTEPVVIMAMPTPECPSHALALTETQRLMLGAGLQNDAVVQMYDPYQSPTPYLGSVEIKVGYDPKYRPRDGDEPLDQIKLKKQFMNMLKNHVLAPGQLLYLDCSSVILHLTVHRVALDQLLASKDLLIEEKGTSQVLSSEPRVRGLLHEGTEQLEGTEIIFLKADKRGVNMKSAPGMARTNAIVSPDFKFEDMGIGGLDSEFSTIFRRAFASRLFSPDLCQKLGILHVKGILLYGPPGTGKTLIARQIGKMLNSREPKVINGPEVLNKFVGQSEENIRKMFADAEKEYKDKGDESMLHIIIFDELDAVCKQRGSGAGGGTGVGDSVVNQLLSKLDGVDQLNNILLIGMTNRKDMIDEALLRPGRLEVQIEISLPDEAGRQQILKIHTSNMVKSNLLDPDVDTAELAARTKNFSGAELNGLVKSATSFAFNRVMGGRSLSPKELAEAEAKIKVCRDDFLGALTEVKPAYGVDEDELADLIDFGIMNYSPNIRGIIADGLNYVENVRQLDKMRKLAILLHGPAATGKTALAAHIAKKSDYPFVKLISASTLAGFRDELAKKDHMHKIFSDAWKSPLSLLILDGIEKLIEWNPVGPRMSNVMVQIITTLITTKPPKGHRLLILATTSRRLVLEQLDMTEAFDRTIAVPAIRNMQELGTVLNESRFFEPTDINECINMVRDYSNSDEVGVGIKTVLSLAQGAQTMDEPVASFAQQLGEAIATRRVNRDL